LGEGNEIKQKLENWQTDLTIYNEGNEIKQKLSNEIRQLAKRKRQLTSCFVAQPSTSQPPKKLPQQRLRKD